MSKKKNPFFFSNYDSNKRKYFKLDAFKNTRHKNITVDIPCGMF